MRHVLASELRKQRGIFTARQARAAGYTPSDIRGRLNSGDWVRLYHGVYTDRWHIEMARGDPRVLHALTFRAATLGLSGDPAASHDSAAFLLGFPVPGEPPERPHATRPRRHRGGAHRSTVIMHHAGLPADHVTQAFQVPSTTPARTVVDLARRLPWERGVEITDAAMHERLVTPVACEAVLRSCDNWPGVHKAARVIRFADSKAESPLESRARIMFADEGLPPPLTQAWLNVGPQRVRVDFLWPQFRTVGEADGLIKYENDATALPREKLRQELIEQCGFEVVRFTWNQVTLRPAETADRIRRAFLRGRAFAA